MPIDRYIAPPRSQWPELTCRATADDTDIEASVREILDTVRRDGDTAVIEYENRFDRASFTQAADLKVTEEEKIQAEESVPQTLKASIRLALENSRKFHEAQLPGTVDLYTTPGVRCLQKAVPLRRVGLYIPGGRAPLFSTVLMLAVPAKVAGCPEIVLCTPPGPDGKANPVIVWTALLCGVTEIYKTGGAQAVAALAYGTESIPAVDKIVGPGNIYVATAKRKVFGKVGIDMIAGPSEILVLADGSCNPAWVAADLLSQAEHDKLASPVLVTDSAELAKAVQAELEVQIPQLPRAAIARASVDTNGKIIVTDDMNKAIDAVNIIAPEHLEICVDDPFAVLNSVKNAGSIFLGKDVPEALGDYFAGPNHTLPTSGTARFSSPLGVDDFVKKSSFIYYTRDALGKVQSRIADFAEHEGLHAHAKSVTIRFEDQ